MRRNHKNHTGSPCRPVFVFYFVKIMSLLIELVEACVQHIEFLFQRISIANIQEPKFLAELL